MQEVEVKIPISPERLNSLKKQLCKVAESKGNFLLKDKYYGSLESHLRIREKKRGQILTIKKKKRRRGIEKNQEIEFNIKGDGFKKLIHKAGISVFAEKIKQSEVFEKDDVRIELNSIKNLGDFIELEVLCKKNFTDIAQRKILKVVKELGFNVSQFDKKYYLEHLKEKKLLLNNSIND